jgi:serine/threonine protein kinase
MKERRLADFGPYRIVRQIATGGMAEIYLARQRGLEGIERVVVLKRILERYAHDAEFVTMFMDEARLLAALSHPNIAQVFDVGKVEQTYYLVMEHVPGPTLGKLLGAARANGGGVLPRREALGIALAVAEALHYVHERRDELGRPLGIVHRDLNPANVMVSYDGAVKLIDFGIAKAATKVYETRAGVIKGTYGYIAPEQLAGHAPVDRRADVFALGILLYETCVGVHPYDVSDEPNLVERILEARYRRPREVRSDFPADLDRLIASCLSPHPDGRPGNVAVLIDTIAAHLGEQRLVPTQSAIAKMARSLVPDPDGPAPLKALTSPRKPGPFANDSTRSLRAPESTTKPTTKPADPWAEPTVRFESNELGESVRNADGPVPGDFPPDDAVPTVPSQRDPREAEVRDPNTLEPTPVVMEAADPRATVMPQKSGFPRLLLLPLALVALALVGAAGFASVSAVLGEDAPQASLPPLAEPGPPRALQLRVVSEPAGATVLVNGRPAQGQTPLDLTLPPGTRQVWLRLSRAGYEDQEREVSTAIGEARFVLRTREPR